MRPDLHLAIDAIAEHPRAANDIGPQRPLTPVCESADAELIEDDVDSRIDMRTHHVAAFLFACAKAALALRLCSLEYIIDAVRRRKAQSRQSAANFDCARNRELVAIFNRLSPLVFSSRDVCPLSSLALIEFLALYKSFPTWVWGVTKRPYCTHSWVQQEGWLFNGPVEYVLQFTPILAV